MDNKDVVIVSACRLAIGKFGGMYANTSALELTIPVMQALVQRSGIDPELIDDCIWGCNYQRTNGENNLARVALVKAGLPITVPGITVHRNCTSSMSSVQLGYYQIKAGEADCIIAGGTDSMSNAQYTIDKMRYGTRIGHTEIRDSMWDSLTNLGIGPAMGITAENLATKYNISRKEQDELALLSHKRAIAAIDKGYFKKEIVPVEVKGQKGTIIADTDEHPRRDVTIEKLAALKPAFKDDGTVTAGNASGINDGAAGVILMSAKKAREVKAPIIGRIISTATAGVDPDIMGIGPVPASRKALEKARLTLKDIQLVEINEAFAAQYLACEKELGLNREITNVNGSGISLGHPVGATGVRLIVTLLHEMKRRNVQYGLATLCAGGGMGTAVVIEHI
ncbi:MAG TPA: thiolase family protein [Spirochaetota bacterium]|nr:thiolase family protein [Spirochaetota bacterium]HOM09555.1 thiolase family protein [Spirochaetota bacterium]HPP49415.1 thiolase family protein [Spirochaetota bacterium]